MQVSELKVVNSKVLLLPHRFGAADRPREMKDGGTRGRSQSVARSIECEMIEVW